MNCAMKNVEILLMIEKKILVKMAISQKGTLQAKYVELKRRNG